MVRRTIVHTFEKMILPLKIPIDQKQRGPFFNIESFRRGPTSVEAVRRGEVGYSFDTQHVRRFLCQGNFFFF